MVTEAVDGAAIQVGYWQGRAVKATAPVGAALTTAARPIELLQALGWLLMTLAFAAFTLMSAAAFAHAIPDLSGRPLPASALVAAFLNTPVLAAAGWQLRGESDVSLTTFLPGLIAESVVLGLAAWPAILVRRKRQRAHGAANGIPAKRMAGPAKTDNSRQRKTGDGFAQGVTDGELDLGVLVTGHKKGQRDPRSR